MGSTGPWPPTTCENDPGIGGVKCEGRQCGANEVCCITSTGSTCKNPDLCGTPSFGCDGPASCKSGTTCRVDIETSTDGMFCTNRYTLTRARCYEDGNAPSGSRSTCNNPGSKCTGSSHDCKAIEVVVTGTQYVSVINVCFAPPGGGG
jgi:hypothetical protein